MPEVTFRAGIRIGDRCMVVVPAGGIRLMVLKNGCRVAASKNGGVLPGSSTPMESRVLASDGMCMMNGVYASGRKTEAAAVFPPAIRLKDRGLIIGRVFQVHAFPQGVS
jgi:hypothetical protein